MPTSPDASPGGGTPARAIRAGLRDSLSIAIGYVPVAISFGLAAVHAGVPPYMAVLLSLLVYAGASQFILVSLLAAGAAPAAIVSIVLLMNLRHLFYGPAVLGRLDPAHRRLPLGVLAAGLTDEVFAASMARLHQCAASVREYWYAGLQLGAYSAWVAGTAAGAWFGQDWLAQSPWLSDTLGFVLPALFFALLLEIRHLVAARVLSAACAVAVLALVVLPVYAAIIAGMLAGVMLAMRFPAASAPPNVSSDPGGHS
ncbi:branched-chain amino acid ABC transporter permease [Pusillimonas sp. TS35]|uniref:AzlC family ABC transporter permease n=1 Tax=Paracandidimonas lactea TaxID=2895524 RepID=UPI00136AAB1E|nr:AzlC family ABC transporter permease [Paracandidimonas lactea]MYN12242.1 branched-chain amino acid ABC transporter permease [Pusillimonas sp. TS35]